MVPGDPTSHLVACHFPLANDEVLPSAPGLDPSILAEADSTGGDGGGRTGAGWDEGAVEKAAPALGDSL